MRCGGGPAKEANRALDNMPTMVHGMGTDTVIAYYREARRLAGVLTDGKLYYRDIEKLLALHGLAMMMIYVNEAGGPARAAFIGPTSVYSEGEAPTVIVAVVAHGHAELLCMYDPKEIRDLAQNEEEKTSFSQMVDKLVTQTPDSMSLPIGLVDRVTAGCWAVEHTGYLPGRYMHRVNEPTQEMLDRMVRSLPLHPPDGIDQMSWTAYVSTANLLGIHRARQPEPDHEFWREINQVRCDGNFFRERRSRRVSRSPMRRRVQPLYSSSACSDRTRTLTVATAHIVRLPLRLLLVADAGHTRHMNETHDTTGRTRTPLPHCPLTVAHTASGIAGDTHALHARISSIVSRKHALLSSEAGRRCTPLCQIMATSCSA